MYRILIAEDEEIVRGTIQKALEEWPDFPLEIIEVSNGADGVAAARSFQPHIILTDIKMPLLDGLKMIEQIKAFLPDVRCLILSGYNDFEFARDALELKVSSYLLKPFDDEELFGKLTQLIGEIRQDRQRGPDEGPVTVSAAQNGALKALLRGEREGPPADLIRESGIDFAGNRYRCALIVAKGLAPDEGKSFYAVSLDFFHNAFWVKQTFLVYMNEEKTELTLLCGSGAPADPSYESQQFERYGAYIRWRFGAGILLGAGEEARNAAQLQASFRQARLAVDSAFFSGEAKPVFYNSRLEDEYRYAVSRLKVHTNLEQIIFDIKSACLAHDMERTGLLLDQMRRLILSYREMGMDRALEECERLIFVLFSSVSEYSVKDCGRTENRFRRQIRDCGTLAGIFEVLRQAAAEAEGLLPCAKTSENQIVMNVKRIIEREYGRGITLGEIAGDLGFSPNYLGALFNQTTGSSFNAYLAECRIRQAKLLLCETDLNMRSISEKIGLGDVTYFSTLFKKMTGISPRAYRKLY